MNSDKIIEKSIEEGAKQTIGKMVDFVSSLLDKICTPAAEEFGLYLRDRVAIFRITNIYKVMVSSDDPAHCCRKQHLYAAGNDYDCASCIFGQNCNGCSLPNRHPGGSWFGYSRSRHNYLALALIQFVISLLDRLGR